jgi:hypothetical protein
MANLTKARARFGWHKRTAQKRGIIFNFTFADWYSWWLSNGIDKDAITVPTNKHTLAMCRFNDTGPYDINNVYCATITQNSKDAQQLYNSKPPYTGKEIKTPLGIFKSKKAAADAFGLDSSAISYRLTKYPTEYYYL